MSTQVFYESKPPVIPELSLGRGPLSPERRQEFSNTLVNDIGELSSFEIDIPPLDQFERPSAIVVDTYALVRSILFRIIDEQQASSHAKPRYWLFSRYRRKH